MLGVLSTIKYHIQPEFAGVWRDALAISKFPICYCAFSRFVSNKTKKSISHLAFVFCKYYLAIVGIFSIINLMVDIPAMYNGYRYGFPLYKFLYHHATFMVSSVICAMGVVASHGNMKNMKLLLWGATAIVLSFRSKPILALVFLVIILIAKFVMGIKHIKLISLRMVLVFVTAITITLFLAESRINKYVENAEEAVRGAMYIHGTEIANEKFPLGSGFCTFASTLSYTYYSPLYHEYGMDRLWGLEEGGGEHGNYSGDTYWPNIYAQYGLGIYLAMLIFVYFTLNRKFVMLSDKWIAAMFLYVYIIAACFAESFLTNDTSVLYALALSVILGQPNKRRHHSLIRKQKDGTHTKFKLNHDR